MKVLKTKVWENGQISPDSVTYVVFRRHVSVIFNSWQPSKMPYDPALLEAARKLDWSALAAIFD